MAIEDRFGYLSKDQFISDITAPVGTGLAGTFQPLNATLSALSSRAIGAASATDILDRAAGDSRYALVSAAGVSSFNTRTGAVTLTSGDVTTALGFTPYNSTNPSGYISSITSVMVTTALGYTPTSVTGLTGTQTVAAFKTGLSLVKGDVGLGSVDNTADAAKAVLSASKWTTARLLAGNSTDGSANVPFANKFIVQGTADTGLSSAQFLGALGTGIMKNTTTTGVLSVAVAADFPTLNQSTTGSAASLTTGRTIAITGDLAWTSPSFDGTGNVTAVGTLTTVNSNVGSFGSATQVATFTVNGKGLTTAAGNVTITPALGSITGFGAGVATALAVAVGSAGAFVAFNGALGTPSSGTLTNCTFPTLNQNTTGSAATLTTSRNIDGQAFNGSANITVIAPGTHAATSKTTPVDADEIPLVDSAASNVLAKLTWANLKATLKTYLDTLYQPVMTTNGTRVFNSAAISVPNITATALTFDSERRDDGSIHSTVSNTDRLTAPTAGWYYIWGNVEYANNITGFRTTSVRLNLAATIIAATQSQAVNGDNTIMNVSCLYYLSAGDYVKLYVYQSSGGALNINASATYSPEFGMVKVAA